MAGKSYTDIEEQFKVLDTNPTKKNLTQRIGLLKKLLGNPPLSARRFVSDQDIYSGLKNIYQELCGRELA